MIELRKVSRQLQDYPSLEALERACEAVTVRTYEGYLADGHAWAWCLVGNIVQEHEYGESHERRRGTKQFLPGTKVFLAPAAWGDGYENIVVIGMPRGCRHYIEIIMRSEYIENLRMQKVYKPAVLKRMCGSAYRWWGDLDADREQIAAYLEARGCGRQIPNGRRNAMQIRPAQECDFAVVKKITHNTIKAIYPHYYPAGAVAFFLHHHNDERIRQDIAEGIVYLCCDAEEQPVGTVTVRQNEIARLFVLPECQGNGYGRELLNFAEAKVAEQYSEIVIDASFSAKAIYLKRGYHETAYRKIETDGGDFLCYDVMKKVCGVNDGIL